MPGSKKARCRRGYVAAVASVAGGMEVMAAQVRQRTSPAAPRHARETVMSTAARQEKCS